MQDMTKGNIFKQIMNFSVFIFIGGLMQNLYLVVDSIILGHYVGKEALAAIGIASPINFVVIGFLIGITQGFSVNMAKSFGENNLEKFRRYFFNSIILCLIVGIIIIILLSITNGYILRFMNTPEDLYDLSHNFLLVLYLGSVSNLFYNLFAGVLRSVGNSFAPLIFLTVAVLCNIVFVFSFVALLGWGIVGSAFATIISQTVAAVSCYMFIKKKYPTLVIRKEEKKIEKKLINKLLRQGIPMGLQFSFTGIGVIIVQAFLNTFGTNHIAGFSVAIRIQNIIIYVFVALGTAISTFTSQNYGARNFKRIDKAVRLTATISIALGIIIAILLLAFGGSLAHLFTNEPNPELIAAATDYFVAVYWAYPLLALLILYRNALQGYGFPISAMLAGIIELIMRVVVVILYTDTYGYLAICYADSITWAVTGIALVLAYMYLSKLRQRKLKTI